MDTRIDQILKVRGETVYLVRTDATPVMTEHRIGTVMVLQAGGTMARIISEQDYVRISVGRSSLSFESPMSEFVTQDLVVVTPEI